MTNLFTLRVAKFLVDFAYYALPVISFLIKTALWVVVISLLIVIPFIIL